MPAVSRRSLGAGLLAATVLVVLLGGVSLRGPATMWGALVPKLRLLLSGRAGGRRSLRRQARFDEVVRAGCTR